MFPEMRTVKSLLILSACGLLISSHGFGEEATVEKSSSSGHGYLFVRLVGASDEVIVSFDFTNQDNGLVVKVNSTECKPAGPNSRICMVVASPGRYFWSKYDSEYLVRLEKSRIQDPPIIRDEPGSAGDTFEIIAGAINYVGDWEMSIRSGNVEQRSLTGAAADVTMVRRWSVDMRQNPETLQKLFEVFPDYANRFGIYLSMMGKKAISLQEFLKIVEQNPE